MGCRGWLIGGYDLGDGCCLFALCEKKSTSLPRVRGNWKPLLGMALLSEWVIDSYSRR